MYAAQWIRSNRTQEPELQSWPYYPDDDDHEWNDPYRAWFKSENTGSGAVSDMVTAPTLEEAIEKAESLEVKK